MVSPIAPPRRPPAPPVGRVHALRAADGLASALAQYAVPLLVFELTGSAGWAGVAFAAEWGPRLAGITAGGPVVDRAAPRRVLLAAGLVRAVVVVAGLGALLFGAGAVVVVAVGIGCGLIAPVGYLAAESLGAAVGREGDGARVQGVQTAIDQAAVLLGPLLSGLLMLAGPYAGLVTVVALSLVAAALAAYRSASQTSAACSGRGGLRSGAAALRTAPALCWMTAGLAGVNLVAGIMAAAAPVLVASAGQSSAATGVAWAATAAAALIAALACARVLRRAGALRVLVAASLAASLAAGGAGWTAGGFLPFVAAMAVLGVAEGAAMVAMRTVRAHLLPPEVFGSAVAVMILLLLAPMPLGGLLVAAAGQQHLPLLLAGAAVLHAGVTVASACGLRRHHRALGLPAAPGRGVSGA